MFGDDCCNTVANHITFRNAVYKSERTIYVAVCARARARECGGGGG
jgi:hypothetical protein